MNNIWEEEIQITGYQTDFEGKWKPSAVFRMLQDVGGYHAEHLGFGHNAMHKKGVAWVLSRVKVVIHRFPRYGDQVKVSTWPKGIQQKIFFVRDYEIKHGDEVLAQVSTAWLLVDLKARRLVPPQRVDYDLPAPLDRSALDDPLEKIAVPDEMLEKLIIETRYSHIDMGGHVNNANYIDWVMDCYSLDEHKGRTLGWIQMNYNNEVTPGDKVVVARGVGKTPGVDIITGMKLGTRQKAFDAAVGWG